jgi:hypothetical protein
MRGSWPTPSKPQLRCNRRRACARPGCHQPLGRGVYLWQTRAAAEAFYTGPWLDGIRERYGMEPQIKYFETACITDNAIEAILLPDPTGQQSPPTPLTAIRRLLIPRSG